MTLKETAGPRRQGSPRTNGLISEALAILRTDFGISMDRSRVVIDDSLRGASRLDSEGVLHIRNPRTFGIGEEFAVAHELTSRLAKREFLADLMAAHLAARLQGRAPDNLGVSANWTNIIKYRLAFERHVLDGMQAFMDELKFETERGKPKPYLSLPLEERRALSRNHLLASKLAYRPNDYRTGMPVIGVMAASDRISYMHFVPYPKVSICDTLQEQGANSLLSPHYGIFGKAAEMSLSLKEQLEGPDPFRSNPDTLPTRLLLMHRMVDYLHPGFMAAAEHLEREIALLSASRRQLRH